MIAPSQSFRRERQRRGLADHLHGRLVQDFISAFLHDGDIRYFTIGAQPQLHHRGSLPMTAFCNRRIFLVLLDSGRDDLLVLLDQCAIATFIRGFGLRRHDGRRWHRHGGRGTRDGRRDNGRLDTGLDDWRRRFARNWFYFRPDLGPRFQTRFGPWFYHWHRWRFRPRLHSCDRRWLRPGFNLRFGPGFQPGFSLGLRTQFGLRHHELRLRFGTRRPDNVGTQNRRWLGLGLPHHRFGYRLDGFTLNDRLFLNRRWRHFLRGDLHLQYARRLGRDGTKTGYKGDQNRVNHH